MARKQKDLIKAATIARVTDKITHKFLGFLVHSNHTDDYYKVTCTKIAGEILWNCNCESGQHGFANCKPDADGNKYCCHIHACQEVCAARKQLNAERDAREIAQREAIQPAYYQACAKAESRHNQGKAAFEQVCKQVRDIEDHYRFEHYVAPIAVEADHKAREIFVQYEAENRVPWEEQQARHEESLVERAERQREEAMKHGGFSLLKIA